MKLSANLEMNVKSLQWHLAWVVALMSALLIPSRKPRSKIVGTWQRLGWKVHNSRTAVVKTRQGHYAAMTKYVFVSCAVYLAINTSALDCTPLPALG